MSARTADFLLELVSEEIPARMQARARADLAQLFAAEIAKSGLASQGIETFSTPRRLALVARGLPLETAAVSEELKGPRTSAPPQALEGFLRKTGLAREQLEDRDGIWFARIDRPGRPTADVLAEAIPAIVRAFPWPKSMRWGAASLSTESPRWVRPLQGVVALLGEEIVPFEVAGIASGAATVGHRFHHPGAITIGGAHDYPEKLRACHVIVDPDERARLIREGAARAAEAAGLALVEDEGLVLENAGLTEWPMPLLGRFDPAFLDVPREVIQLTMRTNQKYFACLDEQGALAPAFVCTANIAAADGGAAIVAGNEKVLAARLADAKFFWEADLKVPLREQADKLGQIVFHEKLGTLADKVDRVAGLAEWLAAEGIVPDCDPALARHAAELAKADLVTQMVGEFPELQGLIGGHLARAQGEPAEVADAIRDHYKPVGQGDEVPTAPVTVAVSLADKLDTLIGFFVIKERPTGSRDPFALRRAALGIIELILRNGLRLELDYATARAGSLLRRQRATGDDERDRAWLEEHLAAELFRAVPDFFVDRLKVQQRDAGIRYDLIDAVFALRHRKDDIVSNLARVHALQTFIETPEGADLLAGYKRAANILKKEGWEDAGAAPAALSYTPEKEEAALIAALDAAGPRAAAAVAAEDFEGAMAALASLRAPVDAFFDGVTVNDPDPARRAARLALLARMRDSVHAVADFSRIEG